MAQLISLGVLTIFALLTIGTYGLDSINERCTISEGLGVTVDSCDGSKFISCQNGRCECNDMVNQVYSSRPEKENNRNRRGIGKKVAIGAGGAFVGYEVAKATSGGGHHSSDNNEKENSKKKIYGCFGRVGAPCALGYNNVRITNLTKNSTDISHNETDHEHNSTTTTTPSPVVFDLQKLPKCIHRAVCKTRTPGDNTTMINTNDPRVGVCACEAGYRRTNTDMCMMSGAYATSIPSSFVMAILILLQAKILF